MGQPGGPVDEEAAAEAVGAPSFSRPPQAPVQVFADDGSRWKPARG